MTETTPAPQVDWTTIAAQSPDTAAGFAAAPAPAAPPNLPPTPPGVGILIGRLPVRCDTKRAIIQLPEAIAGAHCAALVANSGVLSDCNKSSADVCVPAVRHARPVNDREFEVVFWGDGDGKVAGLGWDASAYPGGVPVTRSVEIGVPYVEIWIAVGVGCGCSSENWAPENPSWG